MHVYFIIDNDVLNQSGFDNTVYNGSEIIFISKCKYDYLMFDVNLVA